MELFFSPSILKPTLSVVLDANDGPPIRPIMSVIADLPCGCRPHFTAPTKARSSESKTLGEADTALLPKLPLKFRAILELLHLSVNLSFF
jgi:hypothetical protein